MEAMMKRFFFLTFFLIVIFLISVNAEVSGFDNIIRHEVSSLTRQQAALNPFQGTVKRGNEIKLEIIAFPFLNVIAGETVKLPHYEFELSYDPNHFDHVLTTNLVDGLEVEENNAGFGVIKFRAVKNVMAWFENKPTRFAEVTLLPKTVTSESEIKITEFFVPHTFTFGTDGVLLPMITKFQSGKYQIVDTVPPGGGCRGSCTGKSCGTDGCGRVCGTCEDGQECRAGQCACVPDCTGRACGNDGCGGSCGTCVAGVKCDEVGTNSYCGVPAVVEEIKPVVQKPFNYYYLIGVLLLLMVLAIIIYMYYRKKKEEIGELIQ
jgi:hypothetical protein